MATGRKNHPLREYYRDIHPSYDRVNHIFTFGLDASWRKKAARLCLDDGPGTILDLCTGTGDFLLELARQAGELGVAPEMTGYDFSPEMLDPPGDQALAV